MTSRRLASYRPISGSANTLIPPESYEVFVNTRDFSKDRIRAFAKEQNVAAGTVLDRLQRDRHVVPAAFRHPKKPIRPA